MLEKIKNYYWSMLKKGTLIVIGFLLSPLSWWNDLIINFPLAWLMTWPILRFIDLFISVPRHAFVVIFVVNYWLTNVLGFYLIHLGIKKDTASENKKSILTDILVATVYSLVAAYLLLKNPGNLMSHLGILPSWLN